MNTPRDLHETPQAASSLPVRKSAETLPWLEISANETLRIEAPTPESTAWEDARADNADDGRRSFSFDTASPPPRRIGLGVLAASIVIAAALGSIIGALAGATLARQANEPAAGTINVKSMKETIAQLRSEVASFKSSIADNSKSANTQLAKLAERVERMEKSQVEPAAKLARIAEAVDRLDKRLPAAAEVTGSIVEKHQQRPPIIEGWILRDIFDGRAVVESRHGLYEVEPGSNLPGIGRVDTIKRQDGRWVVVTPKGLIVSYR